MISSLAHWATNSSGNTLYIKRIIMLIRVVISISWKCVYF